MEQSEVPAGLENSFWRGRGEKILKLYNEEMAGFRINGVGETGYPHLNEMISLYPMI